MVEPTVDGAARGASTALPTAPLRRSLRDRGLNVRPYVVLAIAIGLVVAGQVAEDLADSEPLQLLSPTSTHRRWTLIVAVVYMLAISRVVDRLVARSMALLDGVVRVTPQRFKKHGEEMRRPPVTVDLALFGLSAVFVTLIFGPLQTSLPIDDPRTNAPVFLPGGTVEALLVLAAYAVVGWAVLSLVVCTVRRARALGRLSREPLAVDVFDTSNLVPIGNIALATALAPAGIVVILLVGFGRPSSPLSWSLLLLVTLASVVALLLPLRGTHRQMDMAKDESLSKLNARLREAYEAMNVAPLASATDAQLLNHRVATLVNLRKTVGEMTTWPFRDTLAFGRALLIAAAPLIYTVFNELIRVFVVGPLVR